MIVVSEPLLDGKEMDYVREAVETGWISSEGRFIAEFERRWAEYCGTAHGIAVCNGTAALQLAMRALDLEPGSEVILPSCTIISCALAILEAGCVPVLVDSDPETWCLDPDQVAAKITPRTRAIMPVHLLGHPCDMAPLWELADRHGLRIVEDAAEAHGAEYRGRRCGGLGTLACFSFYANKIITTGEGGMVTTADTVLADRLRSLRNLCFRRDRRFLHTELGFNHRLTNLQAAVGLAQVERIEDHIARKRRIAAHYRAHLEGLPLAFPVERPWARNVYWMFGIVLDDAVPFDAAGFAARLRERGVDTRPFFLGMHEQPALLKRGLFRDEGYPVAERLARRALYLPSGLGLGEAELDHVAEAVRTVLA
ncbi:MAG TPA: DegT/DnrJ/EryC1/StrS family aminotransferase [Azospirillum sp.]|nr:DegT/DnrJ/EryC1/StrS family aminotransferase [Azospirillum sp.]